MKTPVMKSLILAAALVAPAIVATAADTVITTDGSRITGRIVLIDEGTLHLETAFAGTIKIAQEQLASFETDTPVVVRLGSGATLEGPVQRTSDNRLRVIAPDGTLETSVAGVAASWQPTAADPEIARRDAEIEKLSRRWTYEASFDVLGRSGNTKELGIGANFTADLRSPNDSFRLFAAYENRERDGQRSADRILGGADYENFFSGDLGWYVRSQLETDRIRQIDLRSTTGAGLTYRTINNERQRLTVRAGLGYQYTSFTSPDENESEGTLDFGINHRLRIADNFLMRNNVTFVPTLDDFGDFSVVHESSLEFPVGQSRFWSVRMGLLNEYESQPAADKRLDTTYFTRMVLSWE